MILLRGGISEETKWITASVSFLLIIPLKSLRVEFKIEELPVMRVEQLQPGIFYQFLVTAVGPNGRLGKGVSSDWLQAPSIGSSTYQPSKSIFPQNLIVSHHNFRYSASHPISI